MTAETTPGTKAAYVVYRHGWNGANQPSRSCPQEVEVWRGEAADGEDAKAKAAERVTVYANQSLSARAASEVEAEELAVERTVDGFFQKAEHNLFRCGVYRPNGGTAMWEYRYEANPVVPEGWEMAAVRDGVLELFRHDGPVLDHASYEAVDPADYPVATLECYTGHDTTLAVRDVGRYAEWLEEELGLDEDEDAYETCLAYALRAVADRLDGGKR